VPCAPIDTQKNFVASAGQTTLSTAVSHVLSAQISSGNTITISTLAKKNKKLVLVKIVAVVQEQSVANAGGWVTRLMEAAYPGQLHIYSLLKGVS